MRVRRPHVLRTPPQGVPPARRRSQFFLPRLNPWVSKLEVIMKRRNVFVRNRRSSVLLERFLIASVTSVLVIRFYLAATGYPQLGGGGLHISHLLWGGLDMLIALVLSLAFLGRRMQSIVALLGGIGFGTFIDELGKF